jgi:enoyl-CoA hydratase/carnithine racemase
MAVVAVDEDGPLLRIGVNRPEANNLWDLEVIQAVSRAYRRLADAAHLRVGVVYGHGRHFTAGLDLASVAPLLVGGDPLAVFPEDGADIVADAVTLPELLLKWIDGL